ncbi:MAG: hypothetical protein IJS39_08640 [Synergistaceae bacterium]|nr:hypothetical protein [Synergistaceae bacterium]
MYFTEEEHKALGDPDSITIDGMTLLSKAVDMQDTMLARGLCEAGANPNYAQRLHSFSQGTGICSRE